MSGSRRGLMLAGIAAVLAPLGARAALGRAKPTPAAPDLAAQADAILRASRARNGSGAGYREDFERVVTALAGLDRVRAA